MASLDYRRHPPRGWLYREKFGDKWWNGPDPLLPFLDVARAICTARRNNKVTAKLKDCVEALEAYTRQRLGIVEEGQSEVMKEVAKAQGCAGCGRKRK